MMEWLESIDRSIVLAINSWNSPFLDELMWLISGKLTWIPLYLLLLILYIRKSGWKRGIFFLVLAILTVVIADQVSVNLFKEFIQRYRPSHHALLTDQLHFYDFGDGNVYKGGQYGFVSSHAANFIGVCTFAWLVLKKWYSKLGYLLAFSSFLVVFSRIYLGVHYLSDVFCGGVLGATIAYLVYKFIFLKFISKISE